MHETTPDASPPAQPAPFSSTAWSLFDLGLAPEEEIERE